MNIFALSNIETRQELSSELTKLCYWIRFQGLRKKRHATEVGQVDRNVQRHCSLTTGKYTVLLYRVFTLPCRSTEYRVEFFVKKAFWAYARLYLHSELSHFPKSIREQLNHAVLKRKL